MGWGKGGLTMEGGVERWGAKVGMVEGKTRRSGMMGGWNDGGME